MKVINSPEELKAWLEAQPSEIVRAVAVRIALRTFPRLGFEGKRPLRINMIFAATRALYISWAKCVYPALDLSRSAKGANLAVLDLDASEQLQIQNTKARTTLRISGQMAAMSMSNDIASSDISSIMYAIFFAAEDANYYSDIEWVNKRIGKSSVAKLSRELISLPLFNSDKSLILSTWRGIKFDLQAGGDHWDIWIDWYENRLSGRSFCFSSLPMAGAEIVADIAMESDDFWRRPPHEVNADIKAQLLAQSEELEPVPGAYQIRVDNNRLKALPTPIEIADLAFAEDLLDGLRSLVNNKKLACDRVQDNDGVSEVFSELSELLNFPAKEIRQGKLQIQMRVLQSLILVHDNPNRESDKTVRSALNAIFESLNDFLSLSKSIRDMESSRAAIQVTNVDQNQLQQALSDFYNVVSQSNNVNPSVLSALSQGDAELAQIDILAHPLNAPPAAIQKILQQRSYILGQKLVTVWNVTVATVKAGTKDLSGRAWTGVGNGVEKGIEGLTGAGLATLAVKLGVPIEMIAMMIPSFLTAKEEVKKLEAQSKVPPAVDK